MNFAAITIGAGLLGTLLVAGLQSAPAISAEGLPANVVVDPEITGSIRASDDHSGIEAVRLIDLKAGTSCKTVIPPADGELAAAPIGPDCANSPSLSRIAYWRSMPGGSLIMADSGGHRILEFAPGDGVMYESVFPANELITIVPARG